MAPDNVPSHVGVLSSYNSRQCPSAALTQGHDALSLTVLVLGQTAVDAVLLAVLRLHVTADIHAVHLDGAGQLHGSSLGRYSLSELVQEHPGRLVVDVHLTGHLERCLALHGVHGQRDDSKDLHEAQLPGGEDGAAGHRELGPTGLLPAFEAASGQHPRADAAAPRAVRFTARFRPTRLLEPVVGLVLAHAQHTRQRQRPGGFREQEMPRHGSARLLDNEKRSIWDSPAAC